MVSCQKRRRESAIFIWLKVQEEKSGRSLLSDFAINESSLKCLINVNILQTFQVQTHRIASIVKTKKRFVVLAPLPYATSIKSWCSLVRGRSDSTFIFSCQQNIDLGFN